MAFENIKPAYGVSEESSFILKYFEDFYSTVLKLKNMVSGTHDPDLTLSDEELSPAEKAAQLTPHAMSPESIITKLKTILDNQAIDSARHGGEFAEKYYHEAQFIMAALADEIFLHTDWSGKTYWENNLLESRMYNTHMAGENLFRNLDEFLKLRDPSRSDIAMIYLLALGLGFKGKYRTHDAGNKIAQYKNDLYIFINHRDPTLFNLSAHIFPETYLHTLEEGKVQFLNDWRPWVIIFMSVFAAMIIISLGIWRINTSATNELMGNIFKYTNEG